MNPHWWTSAEVAHLRRTYPNTVLPGRSRNAISNKAHKLGFQRVTRQTIKSKDLIVRAYMTEGAYEWLRAQPRPMSVTISKLIEEAMKK